MDAGITTNGKVEIQKLSGDKALSGAVYSIKDSSASEVAKITTDNLGKGSAEGLPPGNYTATEVTAPTGYVKNTTPKNFAITYGDTNPVNLVFQNTEKTGAIKIFKQDEQTKKGLASAVFSVKAADGTTVKKATTDKEGYALIESLLPGTYLITEEEAPPGYSKSDKEIRVTIPFNPQEVVNVTFSDEKIKVTPKPTPTPTPPATAGDTPVKVTETATKATVLPQTGDNSDTASIFLGMLVVATGGIVIFRKNW